MYHIVKFHADGGQMCVPGHRSFTNSEEAARFAERMRSAPGHTCGPESVRTYTSEVDLGNEGYEYPLIANSGREMARIQAELQLHSMIESQKSWVERFFERIFP